MGVDGGGDTGKAQEESGCSFYLHSESGLEVCADSDSFLDGFNFEERISKGVLGVEFMMNKVGMRIQKYFLNEFNNFLEILSPSEQAERKGKKKKGKANQNGLTG